MLPGRGMKLDLIPSSQNHSGSVTISPAGKYVLNMWVTPRPDVPGETQRVIHWVDAAALAPVESPG